MLITFLTCIYNLQRKQSGKHHWYDVIVTNPAWRLVVYLSARDNNDSGGLSKNMRQTIRFELASFSDLICACHIFRPQKETQEANFDIQMEIRASPVAYLFNLSVRFDENDLHKPSLPFFAVVKNT